MSTKDANARELGFRFALLIITSMDASLTNGSDTEVNLNQVFQYAQPYFDFFNFPISLDSAKKESFDKTYIAGFQLYHEIVERIKINHGQLTASIFKVAFMATFYVRGRTEGMPETAEASFVTQIQAEGQLIGLAEELKAFFRSPTPDELSKLLTRLTPNTPSIAQDSIPSVIQQFFNGNSYITGQVGVVGNSGTVHIGTLNQTNSGEANGGNLAILGQELTTLRKAMEKGVTEMQASIESIAMAERAALEEQGPAVLDSLRSAGKWALDTATKIGTTVVVKAIEKSIGL